MTGARSSPIESGGDGVGRGEGTERREPFRLGLDQVAESLLQRRELLSWRERGELAGDVEDWQQRLVPLVGKRGQGVRFGDCAAEHAVEVAGEQLGIAEGVG